MAGIMDSLTNAAGTVREQTSTGMLGVVSDLWNDITGVTQAEAATEAANIQATAAQNAANTTLQAVERQIAAQEAAAAQQRADLQPFTQFGAGFIDPAQQAVMQSQELFGPSATDAIMNNPMFQALLNQAQTDIMQNAAVRGRLGTGGTQQHLQDAALRTGFDVLNTERQAAIQNAGFLSSLVGQGQSAAAGQGAGALQTGQGISNAIGSGNATVADLLTGAAAAQAGGVVGAANAQAAGTGNLINLGTTALSFGAPTMGVG